jgi:hypothetical protein
MLGRDHLGCLGINWSMLLICTVSVVFWRKTKTRHLRVCSISDHCRSVSWTVSCRTALSENITFWNNRWLLSTISGNKPLQLWLLLDVHVLCFCSHLFEDNRNHAWYQASAVKQMRTALFRVITRRIVVISCRRFGTTYRSHPTFLDSWPLKMVRY